MSSSVQLSHPYNQADYRIFKALYDGKLDHSALSAMRPTARHHAIYCAKNVLTEPEFNALITGAEGTRPRRSLMKTLSRYLVDVAPASKNFDEFIRRSYSPYVHLYQRRNAQPRAECLLILLTGNSMNFGMDVPRLLQHVGSLDIDILQISDPFGESLRFGTPFLADSLRALAQWVSKTLKTDRYTRRCAFGLSINGLPAFELGHFMALDVAVGFSPCIYSDSHRMIQGRARPPAFNPAQCQAPLNKQMAQVTIVGAKSQRDIDEVEKLHLYHRVHHYQIKGSKEHSVLWELTDNGQLRELFQTLIHARSGGLTRLPKFLSKA